MNGCFQALRDSLCDESHTAMVVPLRLFDKGHIGIVKVQGVNEGEWLIVQDVDVAGKAPGFLP